MSAQAFENPLPCLPDVDGQNLQNGYVYIGEPELDSITNPKAVYWDEAMTQQASQPLRTRGGYLWRNGAPARIWVDGNYSTLVQDSRGRQVFYAANWSAAASANIRFLQAGTGAVTRSVQEKEREQVSVTDFMSAAQKADAAAGTFLVDCTAAWQACINAQTAGNEIYAPPGGYLISGTLTWRNGVRLVGAGSWCTNIKFTGAGILFDLYGISQALIANISLKTDVGGATHAIRIYGNDNKVDCVRITPFTSGGLAGWSKAISIEGSADFLNHSSVNRISRVDMYSVRDYEIVITRAVETYLSDVQTYGIANYTTLIHLLVETGTSGLYLERCAFAYGASGVFVSHTLSTGTAPYNNAPKFLFFDTIVVDTMTGGWGWTFDVSLGANSTAANLTDCWSCGNGTNTGGAVITAGVGGMIFNGGQGITVTAPRIRRNAGNGIMVNNANVSRVWIVDPTVGANNLGNNVDGHGIYIAAAATNIHVAGGQSGNVLDSGTGFQRYGVKFAAVAAVSCSVQGVDLSGNVTGPLQNLSTARVVIVGNLPAVGALPSDVALPHYTVGNGAIYHLAITIAAGASYDLPSRIVGGLLQIRDMTHGGIGNYSLDDLGLGSQTYASAPQFVMSPPGASQIGVACTNTYTRITNGYAGSTTMSVLVQATQVA